MLKSKKAILELITVLILVLAFSITVCSEATENVIIVAVGVDVTSMDPPMSTNITDKNVGSQIYDTLLYRDEEMKIQPNLATSWVLVDDTTMELKLKEGIKFHNGEDFNADDVKFSIDRILDPESKAPSIAQFMAIEKVEVIDKYTVKIVTKEPYPVLPAVLAELWIVPDQYTKDNGPKTLAKEPIGTGPFKFKEWVKDERIVLEANKDYWKGAPKIEKVVFKPIPERGTRIAMLKTGEVDIISELPPFTVEGLKTDKNVDVVTVLGARSYFLGLNTLKGTPLANPKVRQALAYAINVDQIIQETLGGYGSQLASLLIPRNFGYDPDLKLIEYNPTKARELLAEAGYPHGFTVDFDAPNGRYLMDKEVAQVITGQLKEVGIDVNLRVKEWGTFITSFRSETADLAPIWFMGWSIPTFDADAILYALWTPNTYSRYDNQEMTDLLTEARYTMDPEKRLKLYHDALALAREDMIQVPLYQLKDIYGKRTNVNWQPRTDERILLYGASKE